MQLPWRKRHLLSRRWDDQWTWSWTLLIVCSHAVRKPLRNTVLQLLTIVGVCKEEKAKRDECMLNNEDGEKACGDLIAQYKKCMKGYGFEI